MNVTIRREQGLISMPLVGSFEQRSANTKRGNHEDGISISTDRGQVRTQNEDAVLIVGDEDAGVALVADGMGGHEAGRSPVKL